MIYFFYFFPINLKENIFYIQGVDIAGNAGFIEITKKDNISFKEIQN